MNGVLFKYANEKTRFIFAAIVDDTKRECPHRIVVE